MRRRPGLSGNRTVLAYGRFLIRPYGLANSRSELPVTIACSLLLGVVFVVELITPDVVVSVLALLPLLAAVWTLSGRSAATVALVAILLLSVAIVSEASNRVTLVLIGCAILATTLIARLYASSLSYLLASRRHRRSDAPARAVPRTLDGVEPFSHGVRSLTRRELEVASLAAQGYSAGDIGAFLHIGDRTVESHLASIYAKLLINSRRELIGIAPRLAENARGDPGR